MAKTIMFIVDLKLQEGKFMNFVEMVLSNLRFVILLLIIFITLFFVLGGMSGKFIITLLVGAIISIVIATERKEE